MSYTVNVDRMDEVIRECKTNAPKIEELFNDEIIKMLNDAFELTNLLPIESIANRTKQLQVDAAEPIQNAIMEVAKALEEELEDHNSINRSYN